MSTIFDDYKFPPDYLERLEKEEKGDGTELT